MSERAKRASRANNSKTQAALDRLKKLRSGEERAIDYDQEEEDVYDYIDDEEYTEIVRKRTENDWIVDDGEAGYYEDGREIFDDVDYSNEDNNRNGRDAYGSSDKNKKVPLKRKLEHQGKANKKMGNLKNFLISNQKNVQKKSFDQMKVEDDDLLKGILDDINTSTASSARGNCSQHQSSFNKTTNGSNKRKLDDFDDEDLISATANNPFSISTETNFASKKKARTDNFDDFDDDSLFDNHEIPDNLFEKVVPTSSKLSETIDELDEFDTTSEQPIRSTANQSFSTENIKLTSEDLILNENDNDKFLKFYWIDAYEDTLKPSVVYLFGKVYVESMNKYLSCCLICEQIEHKIYLFKRKHRKSDPSKSVTEDDLKDEFNTILNQNRIKIPKYRSKIVNKNYVFDKEIETNGEYLEVLYKPTLYNNLPSNLSGDTFSHIFNHSQSSLERLIIDLKLKGPSWLKIKKPISSYPQLSWCKFEYVIENAFKQISIDSDNQTEVPLSIMTLSIKSHLNSVTKQNEIVSISCMTNPNYFISKNNDATTYDKNKSEIDNFCIITEPASKKSTENPVKFPLGFRDKWANNYKKTTDGLNFQINVALNENELIIKLINKIHNKDPDVLIGHDLDSFDLNVLKKRLVHHKIRGQLWSKMGKLIRGKGDEAKEKDLRNLCNGRLLCDIEIAAKELIRAKSYDLKELALQILKQDQPEFRPENLINYYKSMDSLLRFIDISFEDCKLINNLFNDLNVLPLYFEITKIAGNLFSRTLLGGRSERNEYLLLHAFNEYNYILPDKVSKESKKSNKLTEDIDNIEERAAETLSSNKRNKKAAYAGGLVLDPEKGLHNKFILLMDFNSLYPSIIQEYKICFTTVNRSQFLECLKDAGTVDVDKQKEQLEKLEIIDENLDKEGYCILPTEIKKLVDGRRKVKSLMLQANTSAEMKKQLDIKQKALKLTANSMYGCLGFGNSRFYAKPLAALITLKGREILSKTKQLIESLNLQVLYGDTDSLMIDTRSDSYEEAENLGYKLKAEINKNYNQLEIDIDGIFKSILLITKKKYAALVAKKVNNKIEYSKEIKGLDIVRRDWSLIGRNIGEKVIDELLVEENRPIEQIIENIHNLLSTTANQINNKELRLGLYLITKQLTKDPKEYKDAKGQPHALVAIRWNTENTDNPRKFKAGDVVQYLICKSKENKDNFNSLPATQRAFHPDEYKKRADDLEIDAKYYLQSQIYPIVYRTLVPIADIDENAIAEFLGIESMISSGNRKGADLDYELLTRTNETRFDTCKPLILNCPNRECSQIIELRSLVEKDAKSGKFKLNFDTCSKCSECFANQKHRSYFSNNFSFYLRSLLAEYYQTWYVCEDSICKYRTRRFTSLMTKKGPICPECNENVLYPEITDAQIYLQFNFFAHLLDTKRTINELPKTDDTNLKEIKARLEELSQFYRRLFDVIQKFKKQQAYDIVDLTFLFNKQVFSFVDLHI